MTSPSYFRSSAIVTASGTVVFNASLDIGGQGVFINNGLSTTTIVDTSGPFSGFDSDPSINSGGMIAFFAQLDAGGRGVFISDGASTKRSRRGSGGNWRVA